MKICDPIGSRGYLSLTLSSPRNDQGLDSCSRASSDTLSLVEIGLQTENLLGSIEITASGDDGLSTVFVEETHALGERILTELNKIKQLTIPKKFFFGISFDRLEDFVARQRSW